MGKRLRPGVLLAVEGRGKDAPDGVEELGGIMHEVGRQSAR